MKTTLKLELEEARAMIDAAVRKAQEIGVLETVCIVDDGGYPLSMDRMDETVKSIGTAISDLNVTVGRSYATRDELNDVKKELKDDFKRDLANCAGRRKPNFCADGD